MSHKHHSSTETQKFAMARTSITLQGTPHRRKPILRYPTISASFISTETVKPRKFTTTIHEKQITVTTIENNTRRSVRNRKSEGGLIQVFPEVGSEGSDFVGQNDRIDRRFELPLGIILPKLSQIGPQILIGQHLVAGHHPPMPHGLVGREPLGRTDRQETRNEILGVLGHPPPVLVVELVLPLANLAKELPLIGLDKGGIPPQ
mmetsp:Transcript_19476/g.39888  ORF Transcript_19476/g.39888 Transcript_19476/m.39888 type:complete len:204 (+) Transcript_19476:323-934(+)